MGISPMRRGATGPPMDAFFVDDQNIPFPLTGLTASNLSLTLFNTETQVEVAGNGTWQIINAQQGEAKYFWDASDTASTGRYEVRPSLNTPSLGFIKADPIELIIL